MATGIALGSSATFNSIAIGNLRKITIKQSRESVESTVMSTTSPYRTFIPGLISTEVTLEAYHDAAITPAIGVETAVATLAIDPIGASAATCSAVCTSEKISTPMDGIRERTLTFKVSGAISFT